MIPESKVAGRPESTSTRARGPPVEAPKTIRPWSAGMGRLVPADGGGEVAVRDLDLATTRSACR